MYNPDLVMEYATNGEIGYVYQSDLDAAPGSDVKNPSEAMEYMKWKEENGAEKVRDESVLIIFVKAVWV